MRSVALHLAFVIISKLTLAEGELVTATGFRYAPGGAIRSECQAQTRFTYRRIWLEVKHAGRWGQIEARRSLYCIDQRYLREEVWKSTQSTAIEPLQDQPRPMHGTGREKPS